MRKEPNYKTEILVKFAKKFSVFKISIENKNLQVSDRMQKNIVWQNRHFCFTLCKIHAIWRVKCAKQTTSDMTTLVKLAETKLDFQVSIANKTIEKNSERNQS